MIALRNLTVKFDKKTVLDNLSFDFEDGLKYALMGESGCGKTTILYLPRGCSYQSFA